MVAVRDKHAVVLGGSSGIGYAIAQACVEGGARVTVGSRDPARTAAAARTLGTGARGLEVDATDRAALTRFFAEAGPVDHLVLSISSGGGAGPVRGPPPRPPRGAGDG